MAILTDKEGFRKGFTLIELIVVIALFSLLLGITLPNSGLVRNINQRQELRMIEKDLRQARNRAILENRRVNVTFYKDGNQYIIRYSEENLIKRQKLTSGLRIVYADNNGYNFNGLGRVGNASTLNLEKSNGDLYEIAVAPNTTEISLREVE